MKKQSLVKSLAAVGLAAVCVMGFAGCSEGTNVSGSSGTGGVAATVNGVEIQEDTVTEAIQSIRDQMDLTTDEAWGTWMASYDYTPESVREEILNSYIDQELVKQGCSAMEIEAEDSVVQEYVDQMRANYDSDAAWASALEAVGLTEDEYRQNIKLSIETNELKEKVAAEADDPTDEDVLATAQMYVSAYDGAKKSSHILFDAGDEATAQEVLDKINAGELDFAEAAKEYSKDPGSAADGGNVGWDKLANFVTEYTDALGDLDKDQVSGLVTSNYGIHIIKCTDVFDAPEELTSLDQLPQEIRESITTMVQSSNESQAYYTWLDEQRETADIVINPMPENVPYNIDMTPYIDEKADEGSANDAAQALDENGNPIDLGSAPSEGSDDPSEGDGTEQPADEGEGDAADGAAEEPQPGQPAEQPAE